MAAVGPFSVTRPTQPTVRFAALTDVQPTRINWRCQPIVAIPVGAENLR